jgi:uncharacterized membrane protein YdbT with pleckstrin-like domain
MTSFLNKNLMADEKVIYSTKLHWAIYLWAIPFFLLGLILIFFCHNLGEPPVDTLVKWFGFFFIVACIIYEIYTYFLVKTSEFVVTNKRLIMKKGIITTTTLELLHSKSESISITQGIEGKIFGYGTIVVTGSGGTKNVFASIERPFEFRKIAQDEIGKAQKSLR